MIQLPPQLQIMLADSPVDFRQGIDILAALCRNRFDQNPFSGTLFLFRNRRAIALKLLVYDGQGFWLCTKRFSKGRLAWWPQATGAPLHPLAAHQLSVLLMNGHPELARFAEPWRRLPTDKALHFTYAACCRTSGTATFHGNHCVGSLPPPFIPDHRHQILPDIDVVQSARLDHAHQHIADLRPYLGFVKERILSVQHRQQRAFGGTQRRDHSLRWSSKPCLLL